MKTLVIMPCYQERDNLETTLRALFSAQPEISVLVVDDASPDGTGEIAERLQKEFAQLDVLHRAAKQGLGSAYRAGFDWALERDFELIVEMDADGSHQPKYLAAMLSAAANADLVLGSRWVSGGAVANWPPHRIALSRLGNAYARLMLRSGLRDLTAGYRVYRRELLSELIKHPLRAEGYAFQVELAVRAERMGARVVEVPITFIERENGRSKMTGRIVAEALALITRWGFGSASLGRPRRGRAGRA